MSKMIDTCGSVHELFRELLEPALAAERLQLGPAGEAYLLELCSRAAHRDALHGLQSADDRGPPALASLYFRAREAAPTERFDAYRQLGDIALVISGLFRPYLQRRRALVGLDYYVDMGSTAYGAAATLARGSGFAPVLAELGEKFARVVEALTRVAERTTLSVCDDLADLYAQVQRIPESRRLWDRMAEAQAVPVLVGNAKA